MSNKFDERMMSALMYEDIDYLVGEEKENGEIWSEEEAKEFIDRYQKLIECVESDLLVTLFFDKVDNKYYKIDGYPADSWIDEGSFFGEEAEFYEVEPVGEMITIPKSTRRV